MACVCELFVYSSEPNTSVSGAPLHKKKGSKPGKSRMYICFSDLAWRRDENTSTLRNDTFKVSEVQTFVWWKMKQWEVMFSYKTLPIY